MCLTCLYDYINKDLENTRLVMYINFMTNGPNEQDYYLDDVSANVFIQYIICIDLVFIVFITVRIERYNLTEQIPFSKGTIRLTLGLLLIIGVSVVIRLFFPYMTLQDNALYFHIVFTFLLMVFIPFLMIIGNDKMSMFAGIKWPRNSTTSVTPLNVWNKLFDTKEWFQTLFNGCTWTNSTLSCLGRKKSQTLLQHNWTHKCDGLFFVLWQYTNKPLNLMQHNHDFLLLDIWWTHSKQIFITDVTK